jgi:hypothetical protein
MTITETEDGRLVTIARLTSDQAVGQINNVLKGYENVNQLCFDGIDMNRTVCKALEGRLLQPNKNLISLRFVDCSFYYSYVKDLPDAPPKKQADMTETNDLEDALNNQRLFVQSTPRYRGPGLFFEMSSIRSLVSLRVCSGIITGRMVEGIAEELSQTTVLEELSFSGCRRLDFPSIEFLARGLGSNKSIQALDFGDAHLSDERMSMLLSHLCIPAIRRLDLSNNSVGFRTLEVLATNVLPNCKDLQLLDLSLQRRSLDMQILAPALQHSSLKQLNLTDSQLRDEDVVALVDALVEPNAKLCDLNLSKNRLVTSASLMYLAERLPDIKCLKRLNIRKMTDYKSRHVLNALVKGLQSNTNLMLLRNNVFLVVEKTRQIQYLITVNRGSRRALGERVPLNLWPHIIERASRITYYCPLTQNAKADSTYTLLRNSPALWE